MNAPALCRFATAVAAGHPRNGRELTRPPCPLVPLGTPALPASPTPGLAERGSPRFLVLFFRLAWYTSAWWCLPNFLCSASTTFVCTMCCAGLGGPILPMLVLLGRIQATEPAQRHPRSGAPNVMLTLSVSQLMHGKILYCRGSFHHSSNRHVSRQGVSHHIGSACNMLKSGILV